MGKPNASATRSRLPSPAGGQDVRLEAGMVFSDEHMRRIIAAAREGKNILELPVYDGSEKGEKVYDTLTVIGAEIRAQRARPERCRRGQTGASGLKRWPGHGELFRQNGAKQRPGAGLRHQVRGLRETACRAR